MADENKFKKPLRKLPAEDIEYTQKPYDIREGNTFKKEYEKKALKGKKARGYEDAKDYENKEKVYPDPFAARKAADDEDRQSLKEIKAEKAKKMNHGGEAVTQGVGIALKGTGFKGVF